MTKKLTLKNLLLILTYKCNSKCGHCDIWKDDEHELSFEIIRRIINDPFIRDITHIELSGGEPFIRTDFKDILKLVESKVGADIGISTNGILTDKIINDLNAIENKDRLTIRFSLDGLEKTHDLQRGIKGAFNKTITTAERIRLLYPSIKVEFLFTITRKNYKEILLAYGLIKNIDKAFNFTVGVNQFVKNYKTMIRRYQKEEYEFKSAEVKDIIAQLRILFSKCLQDRNYHEALFIILVIKYLKKEPSGLYCSSPSENLIITADRKIYSCINEEPIGKIGGSSIKGSINHKKREFHAVKGLKKECSQCVLRLGRFPSLYRFLSSFENHILSKKIVCG
jgi:MoaA/NifB/PqqE/SkfB family radical SAM enzyme